MAVLRVALIGYGNVARAFTALLAAEHRRFPFLIVGAHTLNHGTAYGNPLERSFGESAASIGEFLDRSRPEIVVELSTLHPESGEPALSHIRQCFPRGIHVVTANKGPLAHAYRMLHAEAQANQVQFRFESTVMDGAPVFNMMRNCLPGVRILGFTGALNSTSKVIFAAIERGRTFGEGVLEAEALGIAEANPNYDIDGWDSAVKTALLSNVLMDAGVTPSMVTREGIRSISPDNVHEAAAAGERYVLVSRGTRLAEGGVSMSVRPERIHVSDPLAIAQGTSNILLLHTDLMGTIGTVSLSPGVSQTAYGLLSDLVDIARTI